MKIGLYTDVHYCNNSSIIRSQGNIFSRRIENCIDSVNWAEDLFKSNKCDLVVCLGDFFDKSVLTAEEISGLNKIDFDNDVLHYFLVGNHEMKSWDCQISSAHLFNSYDNIIVIDKEDSVVVDNDTELLLLPYITDQEARLPLNEYFPDRGFKKRIILSHSDIKGIRYGSWVSEVGFDLDEIEASCDLFINGHLHNGQFLNDKETILNLGNLTGQNFSEDASMYYHLACILDTDTLDLQFYENPYAYNFYKMDLTNSNNTLRDEVLKDNAVITVRVNERDYAATKEFIHNQSKKIKESRIIVVADRDGGEIEVSEEINSIDHLKLFRDFILEAVEPTAVLKDEVQKILGGN